MRTNFLNLTTAAGNITISICLLIVWGSVLSLKLCVSPSLWLNPVNWTNPDCQTIQDVTKEMSKGNESVNPVNVFNSSDFVSSATTENPHFYLLNAITIGIILPLGAASIIGCFPEKWTPKMHKVDQILTSNRSNLETLKASFVFFLGLIFSLIAAPLWINLSFINTSCKGYIIWNLTTYLASITISIFIILKLKIFQLLIDKMSSKKLGKFKASSSPRKKQKNSKIKTVVATFTTICLAAGCSLHFVKNFVLITGGMTGGVCTNEIYLTSILITTFNVMSLVLSIVTLAFYAVTSIIPPTTINTRTNAECTSTR